jgi:hypothetical protein
MDDGNNANRLRTISPSVPPAEHRIPPANHGIPVPPPYSDKCKILPPPTPSVKRKAKEKDECNIGGILMDLAKNGCEDGTSTPTEKDTGAILPAPTEEDASTIQPEPTEKDPGIIPPAPREKVPESIPLAPSEKAGGTTQPAPTGNEVGMTPDKPTDPTQQGTTQPD